MNRDSVPNPRGLPGEAMFHHRTVWGGGGISNRNIKISYGFFDSVNRRNDDGKG